MKKKATWIIVENVNVSSTSTSTSKVVSFGGGGGNESWSTGPKKGSTGSTLNNPSSSSSTIPNRIEEAVRLVEWQTVSKSDIVRGEALVISRDQVVAAFVRLSEEITLILAHETGAEMEQTLKGMAKDCRDMLFVNLGPRIQWAYNAQKIAATIDPLLVGTRASFYGKKNADTTRQNHLRKFLLASRIMSNYYYNNSLFESPNLVNYANSIDMNVRDSFEETMDILEQTEQIGNDTLDEADLCLPIGIMLICDGQILHSSLCAQDNRDLYKALICWQVPSPNLVGNVDGSDLYSNSFPFYSCVDRHNGCRVEMSYFAINDPNIVLEPRVVSVVSKNNVIIARMLVSQHDSVFGSGHLDPYGL